MDEFIEDSAGYLEDQAGMYDDEYAAEADAAYATLEAPDMADYEAGLSINWGW